MNAMNPESPPGLLGPFRGFSHGWSRYAEFRGRSSRMEFWSFYIVNLFIESLLYAIFLMTQGMTDSLMMLIPLVIHQLVVFIPSISVWVRRLHDIGTSGWWVFWAIISWVIGIIVLLAKFSDTVSGGFGQFEFSEQTQSILSVAIVPIVALAIVFTMSVVNSIPFTVCLLVTTLFFVLVDGIFGKISGAISDYIGLLLEEADLSLVIVVLAVISAAVMVNFTSVAMCFVDGDPGTNE